MKVLLVSPKAKATEAMKNGGGFRIAQMSLAQVAALFPPEVEVEIVDELIDSIPFDTDADIVGLSVMTEVAERAYEVAAELRRRGKTVVMGGIHPTLVPDEAKQHCDAVVIGEAEGLMHALVEDFRRGRVKPSYRRSEPVDLATLPQPRRDLLDRRAYKTVNCVQISRGCPNRCSFCIVPVVHGRRPRRRPVDQVIDEIESLEGSHVFFVDDNLVQNEAHAKQFLRRLAPLRKKFMGQLPVSALQDEELLGLLEKAGAVGFLVGFESISQDALGSIGKRQKVNGFIDGVKRLHDHGLSLIGAFVFGLDSDDRDVFARTVEFVDRSEIDVVQFTLLAPFPGTPIYERLQKENRLVDPKWWLTSSWNLVPYHPAKMTRQELREGWLWALKEAYRLPRILRRVGRQIPNRSAFTSWATLSMNLSYRSGLLRGAASSQPSQGPRAV